MRLVIIGTLLAVGLLGCATTEPDRQTKLLAMASDEAQQITDPKDRLTRQLNFADEQMRRGHAVESRQSLAHAAETLRDSKAMSKDPLDPQIRIAGWVSISELSREAADRPTAEAACDQALSTLHGIEKVSDRPEYVIGVANEVKALRGDAAAAKLLVESAEWTRTIDGPSVRRMALTSIADVIFECKDFNGGLIALRTDADAAWRSDTLASLSALHLHEDNSGSFVGASPMFAQMHAIGGIVASESKSSSYIKPVDFRSVFQEQK